MNSNRGQYTSAPLYNMKNKKAGQQAEQSNGSQPGKAGGGKRFAVLSIVMSAVLPVLFLVALLVPNNILRWIFLACVAVSLLVMWALRAFAKNARGTLSIVYGALAVVIGLALFMNSQAPETRNASSNRASQGALFTDPDAASLNALLSNATPAPTEPAEIPVSAAQSRLEGFMTAWATGIVPDMLPYIVPSWTSQQTSPETALWNITRDSRPVQYTVESVSGSDANTSVTISTKVWLDERNGNEPVLKRLLVVMLRVNNVWYVDPLSLGGTLIDEAAEAAQQSIPMAQSTIAPSPTPAPETATSSVLVYYNEDGGSYYHSTATCSAVAERYWPLSSLPLDMLNSNPYTKLKPCPKCNPPSRP